jgi:hypothetical protein
LKKPARLKTAARLFTDKKSSEAATAIQITSEGRINDPRSYCPYKGKEYLSSRIFKRSFDSYRSRIKTLEKAREAP